MFLVIFAIIIIKITIIIIMIIIATIIILIRMFSGHSRKTLFLTSEKRGPSCPNWGDGGLGTSVRQAANRTEAKRMRRADIVELQKLF